MARVQARCAHVLFFALAPWVLAFALCPLGHAEGEVGRAIVRGKETGGDSAVVALLTTERRLGCTGTLIRPHVILTAAHCLNSELGEPAFVFLGNDLGVEGQALLVVSRLAHPEFEAETLSADIALLGIEGDVDLMPVKLANPPQASELPGLPVRVVGFGCTDLDDDTQGIGLRRSRADTLETSTFEHKLRHGDSTCRGDSGGPVFIEQEGDDRILGVSSSGGAKDGVSFSLATDVRAFKDWIEAEADDVDELLSPDPAEDKPPSGCTLGALPRRSKVGAFWPLCVAALIGRRLRRARLCRPRVGRSY